MKTFRTAFVAIFWSMSIAARASAACAPPPGFVDAPHPQVAPVEDLVSHSEDIVIDRPLASVMKTVLTGTYLLTREMHAFGAAGSRQFDCLSDGSTLEEQSLARSTTDRDFRFRYVVWNYTTAQARPIRYGVGDFHYTATADGRTRIHWTYSFALNRWRFPGFLGPLGDYLFRAGFLDGQYAELMRGVLRGYKTAAENPKA